MTPRSVYAEAVEVARALCADDPNQASREMADPEISQLVPEMRELYLYDFEQFKQTTKHLTADVKAKLLWHFATAWIWLDNDDAVQTHKDKVQKHKKN